jgi:YD repeat-containing protein
VRFPQAGFIHGNLYIDNLTIEGWENSLWAKQAVERFTINANGYAEQKPAYDPAGNCTFDGLYSYTYDAWGRMAQVTRGWRDDDGTLNSGSPVATMKYDGLHRRTTKLVTNSGDWSNGASGMTYEYYWDENWRMLETRNGSDQTLTQHLWGARYVDDLVQIAVNTNLTSGNTCGTAYYALQNANYNVIGLTDAAGTLVERYEYTPYGQRTVYKKAGTNDDLTMAPLYESQPVLLGGQPPTACATSDTRA